ncbi:MAG: hypothetical protein QOE41_1455, partial [Mycobacterium sp.]|nr:hypothetical protein [Mycobacterium sp.]
MNDVVPGHCDARFDKVRAALAALIPIDRGAPLGLRGMFWKNDVRIRYHFQ